MALIQSLLTSDKYSLKSPYTMSPKGVCVHNTYNDASAKNEISYMKSNSSSTSFHVAIDDIESIQGIPFNRSAFHAGDGKYGDGNRNYIGIEICYSKSGGSKFDEAEKRAAKEIASILKQYGWGIDKVKKHQDFSGKYCPHRTLDQGWQRFINMINDELKVITAPSKPSSDNWVLRLQRELNRLGHKDKNGNVLVEDGIAGQLTLSALPLLKKGINGSITCLLQEKLVSLGYNTNGIDSLFGSGTHNAVVLYQKSKGLVADGCVGQNTWKKLLNL